VVERLSLRARLLIAVVVLAAVGLVSADVATYSSLRSFLLHRVDASLVTTARISAGPGRGIRQAPPGVLIQLRSADGSEVLANLPSFDGTTAAALRLPATVSVPAGGARNFTVAAQRTTDSYRVRAVATPDGSSVVLVATSLHDVAATLHRLLIVELLVTGAVLVALAALAYWVVRRSLRPLSAIEATAAAIAAGDLTRRVERADTGTEIGRLGLALNAMLAQIESAFRAREASERKLRRFVADASHELRTPLAAVRAYAELFDRGAAARPDDLARSMSGITRESERMSLLVDDLLLLARLDEGRPLDRSPVDLDEVVTEAVETARTVDPQRVIDVAVEPVRVTGDRERLRQVLDNLLSNVRAHTEADTPAAVVLRRVNGSAEIAVSDDGPGMTQEQASHVFERFYRTDASRTRGSGGVGLGLSIVAAVTAAHGGTVSAAARPGRGSTFRIVLPADAHESRAIAESDHRREPAHASSTA
jgi:two-component system OmpR family sensor kinase